MLTGRCQCGAVEYRVEDAFLYAAYCHCSQCRARTGSAFSTFGGIERSKIEVTTGEDQLTRYGDDATYCCFCRICGSTIYAVVDNGAKVHVQLGTLVDPPTVKPGEHIFVGSKAPWHEIGDGLPQHEEYSA